MLKKCRSGPPAHRELGAYLVVNSKHNLVVRLDSVDLQSLGRGAKVLGEWEILDEVYAEWLSPGV
jgi:hypothetical protein